MPVNKQTNWVEITDFTKGLFDEQSATKQLLGPSGALVVCTDYEPRVGGGLRAFFKGAALTTSGIFQPATSVCGGIWSAAQLADRAGHGTHNYGYDRLVSYIASDNKARLSRMDGTNDETTWKTAYTDTDAASDMSIEATDFERFQTTNGTIFLCWVQRAGGDKGLYSLQMDYSGAAGANGDGGTSKRQAFQGPLHVSQGRLIQCDGAIAFYSDVGTITITSTAAQQVTIDPNDPNNVISVLAGIAPSDLLFGLRGTYWHAVQGDISDVSTPIRALANDHHQRTHYQKPCDAPGGAFVFIEPGGRIFTTDGRTFKSISDQLKKFNLDIGSAFGPGQCCFADHYLFAPGGVVYDFDTGAWFTSSLLSDSAWHFFDGSGKIYMANAEAPMALAIQRIFEGGDATVTRMNSGTIQTIPFRDAGGRDVRITEIQLLAHTYAKTTMTMQVLDETDSVIDSEKLTLQVGTTMTGCLFQGLPTRYSSINLSMSVDDGTSEAPTIEALRVGFDPVNNIIGTPI